MFVVFIHVLKANNETDVSNETTTSRSVLFLLRYSNLLTITIFYLLTSDALSQGSEALLREGSVVHLQKKNK